MIKPSTGRDVYREVLSTYKYRENVPLRGLLIDGRPALTGLTPALVGDYVLLFVRDPLCAYDEDPATQLAQRLERPVLAGKSGMFTSWSGYYRGAHITAISGGSGGPEAELCMFELLEHTNANTFLRVGGSGGLNERVRPGDIVIANGIVRGDGVTAAYVEPGWPAICSEVRPSACCSDGESWSVSPPGKAMNRDTFPEAVLNGQQLDLFALYREVATRGGFKCAACIAPCNHPVTL